MKKRWIIGGILLVVFGGCAFFGWKNVQNSREGLKKREGEIENTYQEFTQNISSYNEKKKKITGYLESYYEEKFKEEYASIYTLYEEADKIVSGIKDEKGELDKNCRDYVSLKSSVNSICSNYASTYQRLLEVYQGDIAAFNEIVSLYNESAPDKVDSFSSKVLMEEEK